MTTSSKTALPKFDEDSVLRRMLEGTVTETGEEFFKALVQNLANALNTSGAWVTEYLEESHRLRALAFWIDGGWVEDFEYDINSTTLCRKVVEERRLVFYPERVMEITSQDFYGAVSYLGIPLLNTDGALLGHLAVIDTKPMGDNARLLAIFRIFAARAGAEMQRLQVESALREREERLSAIVHALPDIVFVINEQGYYLDILTDHEKLLHGRKEDLKGRCFHDVFPCEQADFFLDLVQRTIETGQSQIFEYDLKLSDGLRWFEGRTALLHVTIEGRRCIVMVLRDITDRKRAEKLQIENKYLQ
ncbi:MAG: PAS domain S-box protein, partial [Phycisphaerae bacterium]|nr:PAS domain S-box protein [Phycisphaerae bacterium]